MNKKTLYIIPGHKETTRRRAYQKLSKFALKKGYEVVKINPDWKRSLSKQIFNVEKGAVLFGFSLGGILAQLLAEKNKPSKVILASSTTYLCAHDLKKFLPKGIISDIRKTKGIKIKNYVALYGSLEKKYLPKFVPKNMKYRLIPRTGHNLSAAYIRAIISSL
ncbi:MAG: hypothetical protein HYT68_00570 [Candidatus Zambryskibacteria bacterium]|nr:hypothetical protein [Candidatus Zambryskibacteria bacterium]